MLITPWRGRRQREEDVIMITIKQTNTQTYRQQEGSLNPLSRSQLSPMQSEISP